jgi:hypothetical protein
MRPVPTFPINPSFRKTAFLILVIYDMRPELDMPMPLRIA